VIDEIGADCIVSVGKEGYFELGADAIGARDEHGVVKSCRIQTEDPAKRPDVGHDARRECAAREFLDPADCFVASVDVYATVPIFHN
jgi:hypothetical protein